MNLDHVIKQAKNLGIEPIKLEGYQEPGRLVKVRDKLFLFLNPALSDIEVANIVLHEIAHLKAGDLDNSLAKVPTYSHRIEYQAEAERIIDFLNLINEEYPIDKDFNYLDYMTNAAVPSRYENLVKETAQKLYQENIKKKRI